MSLGVVTGAFVPRRSPVLLQESEQMYEHSTLQCVNLHNELTSHRVWRRPGCWPVH